LLRQGLNDLAALEPSRKTEARPSWFLSLFHSPHYAMAASFLLLVSLGVSSTLLHQLGEQGDPAYAVTPAQIVPLLSVRGTPGAQTINTLLAGTENELSVLMLDPGFDGYSHYRATVFRLQPGTDPSSLAVVASIAEDAGTPSLPCRTHTPQPRGRRDDGRPITFRSCRLPDFPGFAS
jgi:hypothetical protein